MINQFEELLTLTSSAERAAFAGILRDAMTGSATIVATLRPEFLTAMLGSAELACCGHGRSCSARWTGKCYPR